MDVGPFAHAVVREEVLLTGLAKLVARELLFLLVIEVPKLQVGEKVGILGGKLRMGLVGRAGLFGRALARVANLQSRGDDEHLRQAAVCLGREDHSPDPRIDGQTRQPASHVGEALGLVDRAEFVERLGSVADRGRLGRIEERESGDVAKVQRLRLQDDRGEVASLDFGRGVAGAGLIVGLAEEPHAHARADTPAAARALVGRGLRDRLDGQPLGLRAGRVATDPRGARVDHVADTRHGHRRFGHVGGDDDPAPPAGRLEDMLLLRGGKPAIERQDLGGLVAGVAGQRAASKVFGRFEDVALGRQEEEHVAPIGSGELLDRVDDHIEKVLVARVVLVGVFIDQRLIAYLDRIHSPANLQHGGRAAGRGEMLGKLRGVDRGRGDDELQVGPLRQQATDVADQKVDVQRPLVGLVDDDRVVLFQKPIALRFGQQDAVGHQLDVACWATWSRRSGS